MNTTIPAPVDWQQQLARAFTRVEELCRYLDIDPENLPDWQQNAEFPFKVPQSFAACMESSNPDDPLFRQVLPLDAENHSVTGFIADPVGDLDATVTSGVIHKYHGRALLITTAACAIHCRYCFRRNFPYSDNQLTPLKQQQAIDYITNTPSIEEIILSGGDPLLLNDRKLQNLLTQLAGIKTIKRIRLHSRLPVVLPARITPALLRCLDSLPVKVVMVIHSNHANELSFQVQQACRQMQAHRITLLNQSVLLRGVNDQTDVLCHLSERLFECAVLPYYLHQLDKAKGTAHFSVSDAQALDLHQQMQARLPGYLVPKLVREIAGAPSKTPLTQPF